jgi:hypothetical protein
LFHAEKPYPFKIHTQKTRKLSAEAMNQIPPAVEVKTEEEQGNGNISLSRELFSRGGQNQFMESNSVPLSPFERAQEIAHQSVANRRQYIAALEGLLLIPLDAAPTEIYQELINDAKRAIASVVEEFERFWCHEADAIEGV